MGAGKALRTSCSGLGADEEQRLAHNSPSPPEAVPRAALRKKRKESRVLPVIETRNIHRPPSVPPKSFCRKGGSGSPK